MPWKRNEWNETVYQGFVCHACIGMCEKVSACATLFSNRIEILSEHVACLYVSVRLR